jgi:hypothetical protein
VIDLSVDLIFGILCCEKLIVNYLFFKLNMLHKKETSVKNEACVLAFFVTIFHFSVYVKRTMMLPVMVHMYTE